MRRARVNFEIVPDDEVIPVEGVVIPFDDPIEVPPEILPIENPPGVFSVSLEGRELETSIADRLLVELSQAQTQEEVDAILTNAELLGGESFEVELTEPYFEPNAFAVGAVRGSDLALPEELPDIFDPVDSEIIGEVIEIPQEAISITRRSRRNHPTEEVPQQSINQELTPEELQMLEEAVIDAHREIPPNSGTLLVEETTSRFSGAIWFEAIKTKTVMLAGLGGIGSYCSFLLSRLQPANIILFDDDIVETGNLSGQLYSTNDVGNMKTSALVSMMRLYGSYHGTSSYGKYIRSSDTTDIMICGFDNMKARNIYFNNWLARVNSKTTIEEKKKCFFADGRLSAEMLQIFCLRGDDEYFKEQYATKHFFTDSQADETICSYKQTTFMANMIGSLIVNLFVNFVANECEPLIDRDVPFLTEYSAETMFLNTIH